MKLSDGSAKGAISSLHWCKILILDIRTLREVEVLVASTNLPIRLVSARQEDATISARKLVSNVSFRQRCINLLGIDQAGYLGAFCLAPPPI